MFGGDLIHFFIRLLGHLAHQAMQRSLVVEPLVEPRGAVADQRVGEAPVRVAVAVDPRPEPGGDLGADRDRRPQRHRSRIAALSRAPC